MKVKVNRMLSDGMYHVNFEVSDFTAEEIAKMASFGVPHIQLRWWLSGGGMTIGKIPLTKITSRLSASFDSEQAAKSYENGVLLEIRNAVLQLRQSEDQFSSSQEVDL